MNVRTRFFSWWAVLAVLVASPVLPARGANLYWSGNGTTQGGNGTWDTSLTRWGTIATGPYSTVWNNASFDTAFFGGNPAGTATLGTNIDVGGLQFDTTGYTIANGVNTLSFGAADNSIVFNNVAAATINGLVGGAGNVTLSTTNPAQTAATLAFTGNTAGGWSGATTIAPNVTVTLDAAASLNRTLLNTSAINLNGGAISSGIIANNANAGADRINNSANWTVNSGSFTWGSSTAGGAYAETIGTVTLNQGRMNFALNGNLATGNQTLTVGTSGVGLVQTGTSAVTFSNSGAAFDSSVGAGTDVIRVNGITSNTTSGEIIGPWATLGTAANAQADFARYVTDGTFGYVVAAGSTLTTPGESGWGNSTQAYQFGGNTTLTTTRTAAALRYTGAAATLNLGNSTFNLETYGLLNGGSGLLTVSNNSTGGLTTPTGGGNLYLTTGSNSITITAPINNNGGAVTLVQSGSGTLTLSSTSGNYTGGTVLNAGTLVTTADTNLGSGGGIIVNGTATWNMGTNVSVTYNRSLTVNDGAVLTVTSGNAGKTITGVFSGNGAIINTSSTGFTFSNGNNTFTGTVNNGYQMDFASLGDSSNAVNLFNSNSVFNWTGGAKTFALRPFNLQAAGTSFIQNTGSGALVISQPLGITGAAGARTLTLQGTNTANNTFEGIIANGTNGGTSVVGLTKAQAGTWRLTGSNTYTGATQITGGTLRLGNGTAAGSLSPSSAISISSGATFLIDQSDTVTQGTDFSSAAITGAGNFNQAGGGTTILNATNTFSGTTTVSGGTLRLDVNTALQNSILSTAGAGIVDLNTGNSTQFFGGLSGANNLASVITSGYTGNVTSLILNVASGNTPAYSGVIADGAVGMTLTKNGTGTQTLNGTNTYTGGTVINAGTLAINTNAGLGAAGTDITFNANATLSSSTASGSGTLVNLGTRSIILNSGAIATFSTTTDRYNFSIGGNVTGSGGVTAGTSGFWARLSFNGTGNTFTGPITDSRGGNDGINNAMFSFNSIADGVGYGHIILNSFDNNGITYGSGAIAPLTLDNRQIILATGNATFFNNASSQAVNINTNIGFSGAGARQIRFGISGAASHTPGSGINTINGLLTNNGGSAFTPTVNGGLWVFTANNTYNGTTIVSGGTLRANDNVGLPGASSSGGGSNLNVAGGIFETGANLERAGGTGQAQMQVTGNGTTGFSANGGNVQVAFGTIASPTALTWGTAPFSPGTFVLNGTTANGTIEFLNDVALGAATRTVQTSANVATMSGALSGASGALTKTGAGTLTLAGSSANTYGGLTTIAGGSGTLRLGKSGTAQALANGGLTIGSANNNAATVQYTGNSTDMMGTGAVTINGRGILDFNGATDTIGNVSTVSTGATTTNPTPIINTAGGGNLTIGTLGITPVAGFTSVINAGTGGTITLGGTVTFTAATTGQAQITGGGLSLGSATRTFSVGLGTGTGHDLLVDSVISGSAVGLTKTGTGRLILSGNNTYTGLTTVSGGGNLTLSGDNSAMSGGVTLDGATATTRLFIGSATALGNGTFTISGGNNGAFDNSSGGNLTLTTNNAQVWNNDFLFTGTNPLNMGTGNVTMGGTRSLTNGGTLTVGGVISGGAGFGLTKGGGGTLVLSGNASTYTGATTINQGTLSVVSIGNVGVASSLGAPTATANGTIALGSGTLGGTLRYIGTGDTTNRVINLASTTSNVTIDHSGTGLLRFTSNFTATGAGAKTLILSGSTTGTGRIDGNIVNSSSATTLGKTGTGTWTLNGTNTYTGTTTISGGTLQFARNTALYNNAPASWTAANIVVQNGGTIGFNVGGTGEFTTGNITTLLTNLANSSSTTNGMNAGSRFAFDTTNSANGTFTISNVIANSGGASGGARGVTKLGTNTLIFTGNNTYTGSTDVNAGTLRVNGQTAAGSVVTVLAGATLGGNGTVGGPTTIFGIHDPGNSPGVQTFTSDLTYNGGNASVNWELIADTTTNTGNTTFDQIIANSNLDFAAPTGLNLAFNGAGSTVSWNATFWSSNQSWTLHDVAGTTSGIGNFTVNVLDWQDSGSNLLSVARPGASFTLSQSGQDVLINYIAVPEPSTMALLGAGVAFLGLRLARRRKA